MTCSFSAPPSACSRREVQELLFERVIRASVTSESQSATTAQGSERSSCSRSSEAANARDSSGREQVSVLSERKDDHFLVISDRQKDGGAHGRGMEWTLGPHKDPHPFTHTSDRALTQREKTIERPVCGEGTTVESQPAVILCSLSRLLEKRITGAGRQRDMRNLSDQRNDVRDKGAKCCSPAAAAADSQYFCA